MTPRQEAVRRLSGAGVPGSLSFVQGFIRVRHKFTVRTEEDIKRYVLRILDVLPGTEIDNGFLRQRQYPFPSEFECWFRLTGEASRCLGALPTPANAEAPLASPVGRIYHLRQRPTQQTLGGASTVANSRGGSPATEEPQADTAEMESMQQETAGQVAEEAQAQATDTATANGTATVPGVSAPSTGTAGRPPAQPLPAVEAGGAVDTLLKNKDVPDSEKARRLVVDHGYTIANAAKQLSITRGKQMRYQQVYQALHGKEMRAVRDAKQAGKTPEEIEAARQAAAAAPVGTPNASTSTAATTNTAPEAPAPDAAEVETDDTGEDSPSE